MGLLESPSVARSDGLDDLLLGHRDVKCPFTGLFLQSYGPKQAHLLPTTFQSPILVVSYVIFRAYSCA